MKRFITLSIMSFAFALLVVSQFGCATPPANTGNVSVATPEATPDKNAITAELTKIENDWPRIIKDHDAAAVRRIEAEDMVAVYPDGSLGNKEQDIKDMEAGNLSADSWEVADLKVNVLDNDSAVVSGRSIVKGGKYKMPDGKSQDISGEYRWIDTYARRNGQWMLVAGASTPVMKSAATTPATKASASPAASPAMKSSPMPKSSPMMKMAPSPPPKKTP
jgi:hypothetical protein